MSEKLMLFTGNAHPQLAKNIASYLNIPLSDVEVKKFSDGDTLVNINESVRGNDIFIIQPTCYPVNDNLMELLVFIDALKRSSAKRITAVLPWYGYARQEKKIAPREPISAKLVANLITTAGADRILTLDLHAPAIQGFFDIPVDHLTAINLLTNYIKSKNLDNLVVVAPDAGATKHAAKIAKKLHCDIAIAHKTRPKPNVAEASIIIGDVNNKNIVMFDDMIDTAGTMVAVSKLLKENNAQKIFIAATHGVLSGPALERINNSEIEEVIVTDSYPLNEKVDNPKIKVVSIASLLGEAIKRIHNGESISELFKDE